MHHPSVTFRAPFSPWPRTHGPNSRIVLSIIHACRYSRPTATIRWIPHSQSPPPCWLMHQIPICALIATPLDTAQAAYSVVAGNGVQAERQSSHPLPSLPMDRTQCGSPWASTCGSDSDWVAVDWDRRWSDQVVNDASTLQPSSQPFSAEKTTPPFDKCHPTWSGQD